MPINLKVNDSFKKGIIITQEMVKGSAEATGDKNPTRMDEESTKKDYFYSTYLKFLDYECTRI